MARLGCTHVGENRVQEAKEKQMLYKGPKLVWHLIGHLQVNKVRQAVPMFDLIHSVDSKNYWIYASFGDSTSTSMRTIFCNDFLIYCNFFSTLF